MPERAPVRGVLAIDQGTSATKAMLVDEDGSVVRQASVPIGVTYPGAGLVEQDAAEILDSVLAAAAAVIGDDDEVLALGLSTQRESAVVWERATGRPVGPLVGWQDRRTQPAAERLAADGVSADVEAITGLPLDPMFSALKLAWLLDTADPDRRRSEAGELAGGTVDSWLVHALTGLHRVETGNASRTQLLDLSTVAWSPELLELFRVPAAVLPAVAASNEPAVIGERGGPLRGCRLAAVLADSHAALFAHGVRCAGRTKATYGTGSSIMSLLPSADGRATTRGHGLATTVAWRFDAPVYALEGNVLSTGGTVRWIAGLLGRDPDELAALAAGVPSSSTVVVPAFAGLGAPWWDPVARGLIANVDLGTGPAQLARAAFESIVNQIEDVVTAIETASDTPIAAILADGGPTANDWLMQLQADRSQRVVERATVAELSALGAAYAAGVGAGVWSDARAAELAPPRDDFRPDPDSDHVHARAEWRGALQRSRLRTT